MQVLPLYAALLALLFLALSVRTIRLRRSLRIAIGDSGDKTMMRAMRVHANFVEYVPFCLLLLFLVEAKGAHPLLVHALCLCLLVGRLSHAFGVSQAREDFRYRVFGMALTFTTLAASAAYLIYAFATGR
jgi:uncharacterized membrane protein YecN with MAPEG domain